MTSATKDMSTDAEDWIPETLPIPSHWVYADFEDAFDNVPLTGLKIPQKNYLPSGAFPVIDQGSGLIGGHTDDATKVIKRDRSLVVFGDHTKCFKFVNFPFAPGADGVKVLAPRRPIYERFAYYACKSLRLPDRGYSRHYSFLKRSAFPLAPVNEQVRIVDKLEELFSELDKGIDSLKTARQQLKVYQQAVLKHAFEGKLTEQWREENENKLETADALLGRIKKERESRYEKQLEEWKAAVKDWETSGKLTKKPSKPRKPQSIGANCAPLSELPDEWKWESLGNLNVDVFDGPFGSNLKTSDYANEGIRVIRLENIGYLQFIGDKHSYVTEEKYGSLKKHTVHAGDIIFSSFITDGIRVAILPSTIDRAINKADCFCVRLQGETVRNDFVATYLSTKAAYKQAKSEIHGVGRPRINTMQLRSFLIPLCSRDEQDKIMSEIGDKLSLVYHIDNAIVDEFKRSELLRQSILNKAFCGQLVEQDPSDEPASVLLERIKAENTATSNPKKKKKKRKIGKKAA